MREGKICFHCGLEILDKVNYLLTVNDTTHFFCCNGCLSVYKFIIDSNFEDYYIHRTGFSKTGNVDSVSKVTVYDDLSYLSKFVRKKHGYDYIVLAIDGITCAACTWLIEQHLKKMHGISNVFVNLTTCRAHVTWNLSELKLSVMLSEINKLGYIAYPYSYKNLENFYKSEYKSELKKLIVSGVGMSQVMMLSASLYVGESLDMHYMYWNFIRWINFFITTPVLIFSGWNIFVSAFKNLIAKVFGMDFTVSLSLILAYIASVINLIDKSGDVYFDSICMFVFFLLIGRFLEMRARHHSNSIIYSLQELTFGTANLLKDNKISNILIDDININDILLVKAGEIVPVDGDIIDGESNFDEAILTGEAVPIYKGKGFNSSVIGGSTNLINPVLIKSTKNNGESMINAIIRLLDDATSVKPKANIISDKVAGVFILVVLIFTFFSAILWFYLNNGNVFNIVLSMLVITCPCALSLAAPIAITNSINFLTKSGFLITKEHVLERLNNVTDIVFDKTGTLTLNEFILDRVKLNDYISMEFVFFLAATLEENSKHPIAKAFFNFNLNKNTINYSKLKIRNYISKGIEGEIDECVYRLGNPEFIKGWVKEFVNIECNDFYIILANKCKILAWFKLVTPIRKNAVKCVSNLSEFNIETHILSGDSSNNVDYVANILNIKNVYKNASVSDKIEYIKKLQNKKSIIMMVGDGMNDAPALSVSDVSIAMGSGIDLAKISADSILLNNDLLVIPQCIKHAKKLQFIIKQNIFWAIFYNFFGLILSSLNLISPYYAAIGMSLSSLIVVINSLRLSKL